MPCCPETSVRSGLSRRSEPFDSELFLFELKIDGFRTFAYIENGESASLSCRMATSFTDLARWIGESCVQSAVLDGEIDCVDECGRPVFRDLLFRRQQCVFISFDLLFLNRKDLRTLPLIERKAALKKLQRRGKRSRMPSVLAGPHGRDYHVRPCPIRWIQL